MLSLPSFAPREDPSFWPSIGTNTAQLDGTSIEPNIPSSHHGHRRPTSRHGHQHASFRSTLASLTADENKENRRKQNVRRFGAGWIRPPGITKTYQARMDEEAEREEQELLARREQAMMDIAAMQTETANRQAAAQTEVEEAMEEERDLDDDVPDAEADESDISASDDDASDLEEGDTSAVGGDPANLTFNEDSFIEGSMVAAEVEHMLEREEAEMAGVLQDERDLDDDIPEAGSYEHTDTDIDSSAEENDTSQISAPSTRRRRSGRRSSGARGARSQRSSNVMEGNRNSFGFEESSSILDGSSFLRSSPAAARTARGSLRSQFMGARGGRNGQ